MSKVATPTVAALFNLTSFVFDLAEQTGDNRHELRRLHREGMAAQHNVVELCNAFRNERVVSARCEARKELSKARQRTNAAIRRALGGAK